MFYLQLLMSFLGFFKMAHNEKGLWQVGHLKHVRPNVRRYKLLLFNYLQKFSRFPSAETKVQKNFQCSITYVSPTCHKPMLGAVAFVRPPCHLGNCFFLGIKLVLSLNAIITVAVLILTVFDLSSTFGE